MLNKVKKIAVIGDGGWGTTLAIHVAKKGAAVTLWGAFPEYIDYLKKKRENVKFLPSVKIPRNIRMTSDLREALEGSQVVVLATPSQFAADIIGKLRKFDFSDKTILSVIKGIDNATLMRISEIIEKQLKEVRLAVLSGPTIAREVAAGIPSTAVIASKNIKTAKALQAIFNSSTFRIYVNTDVAGVEMGGSVKNVIAIACGVCDGLGFGTNTKAAIVTRGLVEMARLGETLGAKSKTFFGLSGLGDLVTTCFSLQSRNRHVGEELGRGKSIKKITSSMNMIAEGVPTAKAIFHLSKKYGVDMPITREVYNIIYRGKKPLKAVSDLMTRAIKAE